MRWPVAVLIVTVAVVIVGLNTPVRRAGTAAVALGPSSGEQVDAYVSRAAVLPTDGGPYWALVSLRAELTPVAAAATPGAARVSTVVFQVPIERVQTAQLTVDLADQRDRVAEFLAATALAADQLQRSPAIDGRAIGVNRVSVSRLRNDCACVLAMLIRGSAEQLHAVAGESGVRAVQAAPAGTALRALSITPLLPEQHDVAAPLPDDGPIPAP